MEFNQIALETTIGPALMELWSKYSAQPYTHDEEGSLNPLFPSCAWKEQVIVLGLNPSDNPLHRKWVSYPADYNSSGYFKRMGNFMRQAARKYQELFQRTPNDAHGQLFVESELEWFHLDLLYVRATSQRVLEESIWATPEAASFCWEQLQITKKLLNQLRPKMLVVANRFGQKLTGFHQNKKTGDNEWMGFQFSAEADAHGLYKITGSTTNGEPDAFSLAGTPVLFTGSFAGTNIRSAITDEKLTDQIASAYLHSGDSYFERWHMNGPDN